MSSKLTGVQVFDARSGKLSAAVDLELALRPRLHGVEQINGHACYLLPGLVDLAVRLREPGNSHKGSIRSETNAALRAGVCHVLLPPDTSPGIDSTAVLELVLERARVAGAARVYPMAALTRAGAPDESLSEMAALLHAGAIAVGDVGRPIQNPQLMRRALQYAATLDATVHLQPTERALADEGCAHDGRVAARLGLPGIPELAETLALARILMLVEDSGVRAHVGRISSARSVQMIAAAKQRGLPITCDVSIAHLLFCELDLIGFDANMHVLPPLRAQHDRDALLDGVRSGVIDVIVSDHQPHDRDAKLAPFPEAEPGISCIDVFLSLGLKLVQEGHLSLARWMDAVSTAPAQVLGIAVPERVLVAVHAERVPKTSWLSKGANSPFLHWSLPGEVREVLVP